MKAPISGKPEIGGPGMKEQMCRYRAGDGDGGGLGGGDIAPPAPVVAPA